MMHEAEYKYAKTEAGRAVRHNWAKRNSVTLANKRNRRRYHLDRFKARTGCNNCGISGDHRILVFDHIIPLNNSQAKRVYQILSYSLKRIMTEVRKCQVLCANCHAIKSYEERNSK